MTGLTNDRALKAVSVDIAIAMVAIIGYECSTGVKRYSVEELMNDNRR